MLSNSGKAGRNNRIECANEGVGYIRSHDACLVACIHRVEDYASQVENLTVHDHTGKSLSVTRPKPNRWRVETEGALNATVKYHLRCTGRSVTTNWVSQELLVLNGCATFITVTERFNLPIEVELKLASTWKSSASGLSQTADGLANHYLAPDYHTLVDSPIVAGDLSTHEFKIGDSLHRVVDAGDYQRWDGELGTRDLEKIVTETKHIGERSHLIATSFECLSARWRGLEHRNSTLLTSSPNMTTPNMRWLSFVSHEYFHAFNVKRLRPVELSDTMSIHPIRRAFGFRKD